MPTDATTHTFAGIYATGLAALASAPAARIAQLQTAAATEVGATPAQHTARAWHCVDWLQRVAAPRLMEETGETAATLRRIRTAPPISTVAAALELELLISDNGLLLRDTWEPKMSDAQKEAAYEQAEILGTTTGVYAALRYVQVAMPINTLAAMSHFVVWAICDLVWATASAGIVDPKRSPLQLARHVEDLQHSACGLAAQLATI